ncbi:MAG: efflux RND transporter periplasmic adaptor subunit [Thermodesulfovibrionales bacterium]|nr:efflux RND transporter periplasmic adaptor subunit [Thermodesulfovibrionales bacterium]
MRGKKFLAVLAAAGIILAAIVTLRYFGNERPETDVQSGHKDETEEVHTDERTIRLHKEDLKEFGIEVEEAMQGKLTVQLELPGEITSNADRLAHIVPRVPGVASSVFKNLGDNVQAGEVLAVIESRELADTKAAYLAALKRMEIAQANLKREESLFKKKISPEMDYLGAKNAFDEAQIELKSAEQKLHAVGFSEHYLAELPHHPDATYTRYEMKSPLRGTVIEKHITLGEVLKDDSVAFAIADLSSVWINISIYQKDMDSVRKGQPVVISAGMSIPNAKGTVSYISPVTDEETRTAMARVVLPNPKGLLRPGLFVTAKLSVDETTVPVRVPKTALITEGNETMVFIETAEGFIPQTITTGRSDDTYIEVTSGLKPGQRYVAMGGFTFKAQLSKGAFGDGHAH